MALCGKNDNECDELKHLTFVMGIGNLYWLWLLIDGNVLNALYILAV